MSRCGGTTPDGRERAHPFRDQPHGARNSITRKKPQNIPTAPPRSSNKLARALGTLRVELDPIFDVQALRVVAYRAQVRSDEPSLLEPPTDPEAAVCFGLLRKRARDLAAFAFAKRPRGAKLFFDVFASDLLDAELYSSEAPLSRIAESVVLQIREFPMLPGTDLGARVSVLRFLGFRISVADLDGSSSRLTLRSTQTRVLHN